MTDISRKMLVDNYFMKKPQPDYLPQILIVAGGLFVCFAGSQIKERTYTELGEVINVITIGGWRLIAIGIAAVLIAGILWIQKYNSVVNFNNREKATDQQMDDWLNSDKQMVLQESLQALDMESDDANAWPLMIDGPHKDARMAVGDDKILRYSIHDIVIFYLTEHHTATFQCKLDMALGCVVSHSTREFPYKDITNLETTTVNTTTEFASGRKTAVTGRQQFSLHTAGANRLSIDYFFNKSSTNENEYILQPSDAEATIKAVRKKLKEYKDRIIPGVTEFNMSM